jgi:hypothetical protein
MDTIYVLIFYILTSVVPANKDSFQLTANDQGENITLDFTRSAGKWKITPSNDPDKNMYLHFKGKVAYIRPSNTNTYEKLDVLEKVQITPNHKKWSKDTKVIIKEDANDPDSESLTLLVIHDGKNKRTVKMGKHSNPDLTEEDIPVMHLSWK